MVRRLLSLFVGFVGVVSICNGQQDPQVTHFMDDRLSINAGSAGMKDFCFTVIHRKQWIDMPGQPNTTLVNVQAPVSALHGGAGLTYYYDNLGFEHNNLLRLAYSFHQNIGLTGKLGIGFSAGVVNKKIVADWNPPTDDPDIQIPDERVSGTTYDLTFGLFYRIPGKMYVGLSSTHLTESKLKDAKEELTRHYYLMAGYELPIAQHALRFGVLAKNAKSTQLDANVSMLLSNTVTIGATYRLKDAVSPMLGFQLPVGNGLLKFGVAYDFPISRLSETTPGTYEAAINYCFSPKSGKDGERIKNVRFL